MRAQSFSMSTCRCCQFYKPEGRRGGNCQQLGVPVRGCWKACNIGVPVFDRYGSQLQEDLAILEQSLMLDCIPGYAPHEAVPFGIADTSAERENLAMPEPQVKAA